MAFNPLQAVRDVDPGLIAISEHGADGPPSSRRIRRGGQHI